MVISRYDLRQNYELAEGETNRHMIRTCDDAFYRKTTSSSPCSDDREKTMNTRLPLMTLALLLSVPLYARDKTDVMVMTNGDVLSCEVKGLESGVLYVDFDYIDGT